MKNLQRIALVFLLVFSFGISAQAQFKKIGKSVKSSEVKTAKKTANKCPDLRKKN